MSATLQLFRDGAGWRWRLDELGSTVAGGRAPTRDAARDEGNRAKAAYASRTPGTVAVRLRDFDRAASGGPLHLPATKTVLAALSAAWAGDRRLAIAAFDGDLGDFRRASLALAGFRLVPCRCGGRRGRRCRACEGGFPGRVLQLAFFPSDSTTPTPAGETP